ncbi:MAG: hypothetical protein KY429_10590 [Actinobacteria bacterium]|nr:hypothetical protein [Actinomycetota bacterium]
MQVTLEVWRHEGDPKIHIKLLDGPHANERIVVDSRANYSGGNPKLYRALDALLQQDPPGITR